MALYIGLAMEAVRAEEILRDLVQFKDGTAVRGFIVEQVPDGPFKMRTAAGIREYQMADLESITKETVQVEGEKSPVLHCIASAIPGLGQHLNGDHAKGFIIEGVCLASYIVAATSEKGISDQGQAVVFAYYAAMLFGLIDAPVSAIEKNERRKKALYAGKSPGAGPHLCFGLLPAPIGGRVPALTVAFGF